MHLPSILKRLVKIEIKSDSAMTTFIYTLTDERIVTKNNTNNVQEGHYIRVSSDDARHTIEGVVSSVTHVISKRHNGNGLERSTHDIEIEIKPKL